jgi:putative N6-adenine-specific DNA methylase
MEENFKMVAKTFYGFEDILSSELLKLGAQKIEKGSRSVSFYGDKGFMYKANLSLRTAIKILKPIRSFKFKDQEDFYNNLYKIKWEKHLDKDGSFLVSSIIFHSELFNHSKYVSQKVKDAVVDRFRDLFKKRPDVELKHPDIRINIHINRNSCNVSLDSSGESLHKRGYKTFGTVAPINEILAAGIIMMSEWNADTDFLDPMCGGGTILIEAAMIASNMAPNLNRNEFAFEKWKDWDEDLFEVIEKSVISKIIKFDHKIYGYDISSGVIKKAIENIKNAELKIDISVEKKDFFTTSKKNDSKLHILFNPPYDKRISYDIKDLYTKIGDTLKNNYANSNVWLITSNIEALKHIALHTSKKIKLYNSNLESKLVNYDIYEGSKKKKKI